MQQSSDDSKTDWQLLAIRALLKEGKYPQAAQAIGELPNQLSDKQQQELLLLKAQSLVAQQKDCRCPTDIESGENQRAVSGSAGALLRFKDCQRTG
ncbi:penicillin-binding protein activator [Pantoea ananatis]